MLDKIFIIFVAHNNHIQTLHYIINAKKNICIQIQTASFSVVFFFYLCCFRPRNKWNNHRKQGYIVTSRVHCQLLSFTLYERGTASTLHPRYTQTQLARGANRLKQCLLKVTYLSTLFYQC